MSMFCVERAEHPVVKGVGCQIKHWNDYEYYAYLNIFDLIYFV